MRRAITIAIRAGTLRGACRPSNRVSGGPRHYHHSFANQ